MKMSGDHPNKTSITTKNLAILIHYKNPKKKYGNIGEQQIKISDTRNSALESAASPPTSGLSLLSCLDIFMAYRADARKYALVVS